MPQKVFITLNNSEAQTKTTLRFFLMLVRMAEINRATDRKCRQGCRERGTHIHCWWEHKLVQSLWKPE